LESADAGREIADLSGEHVPPCVAERSTFMSPRPIPFEKRHPCGTLSRRAVGDRDRALPTAGAKSGLSHALPGAPGCT
jgi:hypothetical protein